MARQYGVCSLKSLKTEGRVENVGGGSAFPAEKTQWGLVLLLVGAGVVGAFQVGKAPPALSVIRGEFGMSLFMAGWILSIFSLIGLALGSVAGVLADEFGHRRILLAGLIFQALGSLIGAFAHSGPVILAARVVEGFGFLALAVSAPALIVRVTNPGDLRVALSLWSCFLPGGAALIMLLAPALTGNFGWRGLWHFNTVITIAYVIWLARKTTGLRAFPTGFPVKKRNMGRDLLITVTSAGPLLLAFTFTTYTIQWLSVVGFLPTLLVEQQGMSVGAASLFTAGMVFVSVPGNLAGGWLLNHGYKRWRLVVFANLVMGLSGVALYASWLPFAARYTACLTLSGVGGLIPACLLGGVPLYAPSPKHVATTNGLIIQGSQLGQVVGPPALALIVSATGGWSSASWMLGAAAIAGIALSLGLAALDRKRPHLFS